MIFFFYGANSYARNEQVNKMKAQYFKKTGSDFGFEILDGSTIKLEVLRSTLTTSPFLATSRLVVVEDISVNKLVASKLESLLPLVPSSTVVVFSEREIDKRTTIFKELSKTDKVMNFEPLSRAQLISWIKKEVSRMDATIDSSAITELLDACGDDQWRLAQEINKLANYGTAITTKSIRELVLPSVEQTIFQLVESMSAGRGDVAIKGYHRLIQMKESELGILSMIQWQLRNLLFAKSAMGMTSSELAKATGMKPYVAGKMQVIQRKVTQERLVEAFKQSVDCEQDIKSGKIPAELAVEQLIYRVALLCLPKS